MDSPLRAPAGAAPVDVRGGTPAIAAGTAPHRPARCAPPARPRPRPAGVATAPAPAPAAVRPAAAEPVSAVGTPTGRRRPALATGVLAGLVVSLVGAGAALTVVSAAGPGPSAPATLAGELPTPVDVTVTTADIDAEAPPPRRLLVERIGVDEPLVGLRVLPDGTLETPADPDDVGWHRSGTAPGDRGPAVLVGHVDSYEGAAVFFRLRELQPGDRAAVTRVDGSFVEFEVYGVETVPKDAFPTDRVYGATEGPELRLVTCGGAFDEATRSYTENVVAYLRAVAPAGAGT